MIAVESELEGVAARYSSVPRPSTDELPGYPASATSEPRRVEWRRRELNPQTISRHPAPE